MNPLVGSRPMAARDIRPQNEGIACAVCARTLLRGEQIETYLTGGQRRTVCELCVGRANHMGWIRERAGLQPGGEAVRGESRRPLLARIRSRRGRRPEPPSPSPEEATPAEGPPAAPVRAQASEPREPRHVHAI